MKTRWKKQWWYQVTFLMLLLFKIFGYIWQYVEKKWKNILNLVFFFEIGTRSCWEPTSWFYNLVRQSWRRRTHWRCVAWQRAFCFSICCLTTDFMFRIEHVVGCHCHSLYYINFAIVDCCCCVYILEKCKKKYIYFIF